MSRCAIEGVINCPASLEFTEIMGKRFCAASIIDLVVATSYIGTPTQTHTETQRHETQSCTPDIIRLLLDHRYRRYWRCIGDVRELSHLLASEASDDLRSVSAAFPLRFQDIYCQHSGHLWCPGQCLGIAVEP